MNNAQCLSGKRLAAWKMRTVSDATTAIPRGHWVATDETALHLVAQDDPENKIVHRAGGSS